MKSCWILWITLLFPLLGFSQNLSDAYPDFESLNWEIRRYEEPNHSVLSSIQGKDRKPDFISWEKTLKKSEDHNKEYSFVSFYYIGNELRYVSADSKDEAHLFRVSSNFIELVHYLKNYQNRLWTSQVNVSRWKWFYDAEGKKTSDEAYTWESSSKIWHKYVPQK